MGNKLTREQAFAILCGERDYQAARGVATDGHEHYHSIGEMLLYMDDYMTEAKHIASRTWGRRADPLTMEVIRKVTALGLACMEYHGCPERLGYEQLRHILQAEIALGPEKTAELVQGLVGEAVEPPEAEGLADEEAFVHPVPAPQPNPAALPADEASLHTLAADPRVYPAPATPWVDPDNESDPLPYDGPCAARSLAEEAAPPPHAPGHPEERPGEPVEEDHHYDHTPMVNTTRGFDEDDEIPF